MKKDGFHVEGGAGERNHGHPVHSSKNIVTKGGVGVTKFCLGGEVGHCRFMGRLFLCFG